MHKRKISEDFPYSNSNSTRKKVPSQSFNRPKSEVNNSSSLSSTLKPENHHPAHDGVCIAHVIQEKVSNLKHKFSELDDMRRRYLESRIDMQDFDNQVDTFQFYRGRSTDFNTASFSQDFNKTGPVSFIDRAMLEEKLGRELHTEKKSTQKALLEKSILERESAEKISSLQSEIKNLSLEIESLNSKLLSYQQTLAFHETSKKSYEKNIYSLKSSLESLHSQLDSSSSTIKTLKQHNSELQLKVKDLSAASINTAIKNLSNIILSKDYLLKPEATVPQFINKYLEILQGLHDSDTFALNILQKLESKNYRKAQEKLVKVKPLILERIERTCESIEELEKVWCESRTPGEEKGRVNEVKAEACENERQDWVAWIKCQAAIIEDLLVTSDLSD